MAQKLKMWKEEHSWEENEQAWDVRAEEAANKLKVKTLSSLPQMEGITKETARFLKWKSFKWMVSQDHDRKVTKSVLKHPLRYGWRYLCSLFKKHSFSREGDFFLYGVSSLGVFQELLERRDTLFVVGFSYCHKPFECPSGRFTSACVHDPENLVCRQCFIGKAMHALPEENTVPLVIPTVHYIGGKIFKIMEQYPDRQVIFMITACEMTLQMFGDWGNMAGIRGIGIRLDGRICNTMKAFELSEKGTKPGLTVVLDDTKRQMLEWIKRWRDRKTRNDASS